MISIFCSLCIGYGALLLRTVELMMRINSDKVRGVLVQYLVDRAKVAGDIDTAITDVFPLKRVIVENRVKRILKKNVLALLKLLLLAYAKFCILLLKSGMKTHLHNEWR